MSLHAPPDPVDVVAPQRRSTLAPPVKEQTERTQPTRRLGVVHAAAVCVGMVIGAGIFKTAPVVAASLQSPWTVLAAWALGGVMAIAGALCFAEMAAAFPDAGGDYHFLRLAYGRQVGFLFAWSRFAVIHTGSMALLAFVFGDYLGQIVDFGPFTQTGLAATALLSLVAINVAGVRIGFDIQLVLTSVVLAGLLAVGAAGLWLAWQGVPVSMSKAALALAASGGSGIGGSSGLGSSTGPNPIDPTLGFGSAMVFVSLAYGGWSDTATLSAEMRDARRGMRRALLLGMTTVTALYLLANWAYLRGLGMDGLAASAAPAADLMRAAFGRGGELAIVIAVAVASVAVMNALLIAGARTTYAAARDLVRAEFAVPTPGADDDAQMRAAAVVQSAVGNDTDQKKKAHGVVARMGTWDPERGGPATAMVAMGAVALALVGFGAWTRGGFTTMVDYLSPVYWMFLVLSGIALLRLRRKYPMSIRPFKVPLYPFLPLLFCAASGYVFYASVAYVKIGAVVSVAVLALGVVVLAAFQRKARR